MEQKKADHRVTQSGLDSPSPVSGRRVQLKRELAAMSYAEQVEAVRPPRPVSAGTPQVQANAERGQLQLEGGGSGTDSIQTIAAKGASGSGAALPHLDAVQRSFGPAADLSSVKAHTGDQAQQANAKMGSTAYAYGENVSFKSAPSLHTAAHEAAHVVQQRAGVQLPGGVGRTGDQYERQANAIADRVVQGKSAVDLIAKAAGIDLASTNVQHSVQFGDDLSKAEMVDFISDKVANPSDSSLRQTYEAGVRALASTAEAGVTALGIELEAFNNAKKSSRSDPVALPKKDDAKLAALAQEMVQSRLQLSTDTKHLTLRPLLKYIFVQNEARYPSKYGPTYDFLKAGGKTNAQVIGGSCRPNPDINRFLGNFKSWLGGLGEDKVKEYYGDAKANRLGE